MSIRGKSIIFFSLLTATLCIAFAIMRPNQDTVFTAILISIITVGNVFTQLTISNLEQRLDSGNCGSEK